MVCNSQKDLSISFNISRSEFKFFYESLKLNPEFNVDREHVAHIDSGALLRCDDEWLGMHKITIYRNIDHKYSHLLS